MTWETTIPGVVKMPSGRLVRGRRFVAEAMPAPDFGLYALWSRPTTAWPHRWVRWPDFGLPLNGADARAAIEDLWERAVSERVEVACSGGRGRTGTVLAALAMLDGLDRNAAVTWVRDRYDARAVETPWQRWWLGR